MNIYNADYFDTNIYFTVSFCIVIKYALFGIWFTFSFSYTTYCIRNIFTKSVPHVKFIWIGTVNHILEQFSISILYFQYIKTF